MIAKDIYLVRGDDCTRYAVGWRDSDGVYVPIASARLQIRETTDAESELLELTDGDGLEIVDEGRVNITFTAAQTETLESGRWDIEVTSEGGQVKTLVGGRCVVKEDVSRDE